MIVLEADAVSALGDEVWPDVVEYIFVEDASKIFHRTRYINELLRMAETKVAAVLDTDVLVDYAQIDEAVRLILEGCTSLILIMDSLQSFLNKCRYKMRKKLDLEYLCHMKLCYYFDVDFWRCLFGKLSAIFAVWRRE